MNYPPFFVEELSCPVLEIDFKDRKNDDYLCSLPDVIDPNEDDQVEITIKKGLSSRYARFDRSSMSIVIDYSKVEEGDIGYKTVEILLKDLYGAEVIYTVVIDIRQVTNSQAQNLAASDNLDDDGIDPNCIVKPIQTTNQWDFIETVKAVFKSLLILSALLSLIGGWSFWMFVSLIRTYQIVVHLPLSRVIFPYNVMQFFKMMLPIVHFDLLEGIFGDDPLLTNAQEKVHFKQVD